MKKTNELNSRQWRLYEYLKNQDGFVYQNKIIEDLKSYYGVPNDDAPFHDSAQRQTLTKDLTVLKADSTIQLIIISSCKGIKMATKEEAEAYFESERGRLINQLKVLRIQKKKALKHGQFRVVFNKEKQVIQAYIDGGVN